MALGNPALNKIPGFGKVTTNGNINIRQAPNTTVPVVNIVPGNIQLAYDGYVDNGENVSGNSKWYYTDEGNWFWSGGVS